MLACGCGAVRRECRGSASCSYCKVAETAICCCIALASSRSASSCMRRPTLPVRVCSRAAAVLVQVCRLFDLFLATHPLMPLYVGAVAMHSQRSQLLAAEEMPMLHSKLVNLAITKRATADQLAVQVRLICVLAGQCSCCCQLAVCSTVQGVLHVFCIRLLPVYHGWLKQHHHTPCTHELKFLTHAFGYCLTAGH